MNQTEKRFTQVVYNYYHEYGRHDLPWRLTADPYCILVSEVMLQQTQVHRVIPKYQAFLQRFPNVKQLAEAPLRDVLTLWQGLGYNRRAQALWRCAQQVHNEHGDCFPVSPATLMTLPGVGPYTASAVCTFAFNQSVVCIETNIRTVYLQHFFTKKINVSDREILPIIERTIDHQQPRIWYWALMDYGAYLKSVHRINNRQSKHYTKQSRFVGSDRQIRGALIRVLTSTQVATSIQGIKKELSDHAAVRINEQLQALAREGLVVKRGRGWSLPD